MSYLKRAAVERDEEWSKWLDKIPHLRFKEDWNVKIKRTVHRPVDKIVISVEVR